MVFVPKEKELERASETLGEARRLFERLVHLCGLADGQTTEAGMLAHRINHLLNSAHHELWAQWEEEE